jgi:glycosyltransferase involved in cell wall biosynthesis
MSERLRIALVAPAWLPVPPLAYGGTELIVDLLRRSYAAAGHEVVLFAPGDSDPGESELRAVTPTGLIELMARGEAATYDHYVNAVAADVVAASGEFDVVHSHLGMAQVPALSLAACPVVQTVHIPLDLDDCWIANRYPDVEIVTLTEVQAAKLNRSVRVVPHGLDLGRYRFSRQTGGSLAFLGRMGPGKNPLGAIEIAAACDRGIILAGAPQNSEEKQYFRERIEPLIDGERVRYVGPVDHAAKVDLLGDAAVMLFPIAADEAFGLVMIEAMACGTPVVAVRRASVSEVVDPGVTGFFADDVNGLADLVDEAAALDRAAVRRRAEQRFSAIEMGDGYLAIFEELTS